MNVYRISRKPKDVDYFEDYAIVVIAEDRRHAERRARWSSDDFRKAKNLEITKIDLSYEQVVLTASVSG